LDVGCWQTRAPRHFRLGVLGALKAWNPANTAPDKNPDFNNRLVVVKRTPFVEAQEGRGTLLGRVTDPSFCPKLWRSH